MRDMLFHQHRASALLHISGQRSIPAHFRSRRLAILNRVTASRLACCGSITHRARAAATRIWTRGAGKRRGCRGIVGGSGSSIIEINWQ